MCNIDADLPMMLHSMMIIGLKRFSTLLLEIHPRLGKSLMRESLMFRTYCICQTFLFTDLRVVSILSLVVPLCLIHLNWSRRWKRCTMGRLLWSLTVFPQSRNYRYALFIIGFIRNSSCKGLCDLIIFYTGSIFNSYSTIEDSIWISCWEQIPKCNEALFFNTHSFVISYDTNLVFIFLHIILILGCANTFRQR